MTYFYPSYLRFTVGIIAKHKQGGEKRKRKEWVIHGAK